MIDNFLNTASTFADPNSGIGSKVGSIGGLLLAPFTGGASLPIMSGIGGMMDAEKRRRELRDRAYKLQAKRQAQMNMYQEIATQDYGY